MKTHSVLRVAWTVILGIEFTSSLLIPIPNLATRPRRRVLVRGAWRQR